MALPDDATEKLGYRLPTEAEWEYFCRAGSVTVRPYGHSDALLSRYAWTVANSQDHAWPVGLLLPNDFGIFDVLGNVWEWCHERFVADPRDNPQGEASIDGMNDRSMRGGSFLYIPSTARSAHRDSTRAGRRVPYLGLRVVRTLPRESGRIFGQGPD